VEYPGPSAGIFVFDWECAQHGETRSPTCFIITDPACSRGSQRQQVLLGAVVQRAQYSPTTLSRIGMVRLQGIALVLALATRGCTPDQ